MRKLRMVSVAWALAGLCLATQVRAGNLADRAPADAVGFMSWAGTAALGDAYQGSHLKGMLEALKLPELISQRMEEALKKTDDPQKQADQKARREWIEAVLRAPTALYFGPVDFANAAAPEFKVAIYSQVGQEPAKMFAAQMNTLIERKKREKGPLVKATAAGDFLLVTIGSPMEMEKRLVGMVPADGLSRVAGFQKAMGQVGAGANPPAMLLYVNGEAAVKMIGEGVAAKGGMRAEMWPKVAEALGLNGLKECAVLGDFDGANWSSQSFVGMGEKRTGILSLLESKRLPDEVMKLIPKGATCAGVWRMDLTRLFHEIRDAAGVIEPQRGQRGFDMWVQQFFAFTGVDLLKDLLEPLDDAFVMFAVADGKGDLIKNAVIANKLKDAAKAETGFTTLESVISAMMAQRNPNGVQFKTENLPAPNEKVSAHIISGATVSPAWAVSDGVGYFSMSLAGLQGAVEGTGKNGAITENPQFAELWKKVGHKEMSGFVYLDLTKLAGEFYPLAAKKLAERKAAAGGEKIRFELPALDKITPNLGPALSVYWTDKEGYHSKGTGPLPLVEMLRPETLIQWMAVMGTVRRSAPERNLP